MSFRNYSFLGSEILTTQDWFTVIAIVLSIGSLIVSALSYRISSAIEQDRKKEKRQANLIARLFKKDSSSSRSPEFFLQIKNNGKGKARDIKILIDDEPAQNYVVFGYSGIGENDIPRELEPDASWDPHMEYCIGVEAKFKINLTWSDSSLLL